MARINVIISIVFVFFSIFVIVLANALPVSASQPLTLGTPMFPRGLSYGIIILSAILFLTNIREALNEKKEDRIRMLEPDSIKTVGMGLGIIIASAILMIYVGFLIAMIAMNLAFLLFFKVKNKLVLILEPILVTFVIYALFKYLLSIPLPSGKLFY
jgi:putative tricarboxylic transport membrane protein